MGKHHAVTYDADGQFVFDEDQKIEDRQKFYIYNLLDKTIKVEVFPRYKISSKNPLIMLETTNDYEFESTLEICLNTYVPRPYQQLGINQADRTISWNTGKLLKTDKHHYHYFGNTDGMCGDVIFDQYLRFIGIVVGKEEGHIKILVSIIVRANISKGVDLDEVDYT
ncbi:hypothetical protein CAEBREN_19505 [Caenorhabditis brenneri]|uniref:Uncharacterized protein n=1 Tax=Caenorhabditis brenneri TaxID=135651 RepID=G0NE67_CAEBE|nr:hypothetical protein CAEBREN_19505 [Caenorhabditis brenneri]